MQLVMVAPSYNLIIIEADLKTAWVAEQTLSQPLPPQPRVYISFYKGSFPSLEVCLLNITLSCTFTRHLKVIFLYTTNNHSDYFSVLSILTGEKHLFYFDDFDK